MNKESNRGEQVRSEVNVSSLKSWAMRNLSSVSHLRAVLVFEKDILSVDQFLAKMDIWLKLAELEDS
jgi:hypothetical protein